MTTTTDDTTVPSAPKGAPDIDIVNRILSARNPYEVLGVDVIFVTDLNNKRALKKIYHKLCLKVHPDKNLAPRSTEAFEKLNNAYAALRDDKVPISFKPTKPDLKKCRCTAMTQKDIACKNKAKDGSKYCHTHRDFDPTKYQAQQSKPKLPPKQKCAATTKHGDSCKNNAKQDTQFCNIHTK